MTTVIRDETNTNIVSIGISQGTGVSGSYPLSLWSDDIFSVVETAEIMNDPDLMAQLPLNADAIAKKEYVDLDGLDEALGL